MNRDDIRKQAFAMPFNSPAYPRGPYHFHNREYLILTYRTDAEKLRQLIPEPLEFDEPFVKFEFISMPDSTGFGHYCEAGQVIPIRYHGEPGSYVLSMYLNDLAPIAAGRELWGFPKKWGQPKLSVHTDTLMGTLNYSDCRIATGTMGFKYQALDPNQIQTALAQPNYLLKIIPDVDGSPRICELVRYFQTDIQVKGAWTGPGALELHPHALAPVAALPILEIVSAQHILANLTLALGEVVYDYLSVKNP